MSEQAAPTRLLMTTDTVGGVWNYSLELARGLARHNFQITLATMGAPVSEQQKSEASGVANARVFESSFALEWMPEPWEDVDRAGEWLLRLSRETRPDVAHLNGYAHAALPWEVPVVCVGHSCVLSWWLAVKGRAAPASWQEYQRRAQTGLRSASAVIAPTQAMLDGLAFHYGHLPGPRVIHNGVDPAGFAPQAKEPFILAAGRLGDEAKNIAAFGKACESLPWPVFVAGAANDASGRAALPANLERLGQLAAPELRRWMERAAIYCLPARYEPFGLSILEAAFAGCALVLGDIPSLRELWQGAALFVPPDDPIRLRASLLSLIEDSQLCCQLGHAARERATSFSRERMADAYAELYASLLRQPAPACAR